jgi:hypothetical protein
MTTDIIDSVVVEAIDRIAGFAPGIVNWWEDLVMPAKSLHEEYTDRVL